jgi:hypothetical protein
MINNNTTTANNNNLIIMMTPMTVNGTAWRGRAKNPYQFGRVLENEAEALMNFARRYVAALSHRSSKSRESRVENIRLSIVVCLKIVYP